LCDIHSLSYIMFAVICWVIQCLQT